MIICKNISLFPQVVHQRSGPSGHPVFGPSGNRLEKRAWNSFFTGGFGKRSWTNHLTRDGSGCCNCCDDDEDGDIDDDYY